MKRKERAARRNEKLQPDLTGAKWLDVPSKGAAIQAEEISIVNDG